MLMKQIKTILIAALFVFAATCCLASCSAPNGMNGVDGTGVDDTVNSNDGNTDKGLGDRDGNRMTDSDGSLLGDVTDSAGDAVRNAGNAVGDAINGIGSGTGIGSSAQNDGINAKPGGGNTTANR